MRAAAALLSLTLASPAVAADALVVYAVNAPLAYFAERIGGDSVDVGFPVPENRDPASWRPSIETILAFQQADLILLNGAGYAEWTARASLPRLRTVDTSAAFADRLIETEAVTHSHGPEGEHSHAEVASHVWLDFGLAALQADAVAEALVKQAPAAAEAFADGLAKLKADLAALDARARELGAVMDVRLISSHPRYQYFARAYRFELESVDWSAGETPTPEQWTALDALLGNRSDAVFLWETQPTAAAAAELAEREMPSIVFETGASAGGAPFIEGMWKNLDDLAAFRSLESEPEGRP